MVQAEDMEELRRRQDRISASELRFRSVVQSAADAIILSDDSGQIVFWNKGAETIFGYTEDEIIGAPLETLMPEQYRASQRLEFERLRSMGRAQNVGSPVELMALRKDGSAFPIELSLASWTNGSCTMLTAVIRDVSERKRSEEWRRAKETAEATNLAKSTAIARVSHELRSPLNSILGFASLLLKNPAGNLTPFEKDLLERIVQNSKDQLELINSMLDLSKTEPSAHWLDAHSRAG
jgi:PAS domain S-box-containing protein